MFRKTELVSDMLSMFTALLEATFSEDRFAASIAFRWGATILNDYADKFARDLPTKDASELYVRQLNGQ